MAFMMVPLTRTRGAQRYGGGRMVLALQIVQIDEIDESAGQCVQQEMAGAEVGRGRPDTRTGAELESGPGGWPVPAVDVEPHGQQRAQRPAGQADLDAVGTRVAIVVDGPAEQAPGDVQVGVGPGALPAL